MGNVPAASRSGAVLFELEELIGVDTRVFVALLDLARAEGAAGDGMAEERVLGGVGSGLHTCNGRVQYSIGLGGGEGRGQRAEGRICLLLQERDERLEEEEEEGEGYGREGRTLHTAPGSRQL